MVNQNNENCIFVVNISFLHMIQIQMPNPNAKSNNPQIKPNTKINNPQIILSLIFVKIHYVIQHSKVCYAKNRNQFTQNSIIHQCNSRSLKLLSLLASPTIKFIIKTRISYLKFIIWRLFNGTCVIVSVNSCLCFCCNSCQFKIVKS